MPHVMHLVYNLCVVLCVVSHPMLRRCEYSNRAPKRARNLLHVFLSGMQDISKPDGQRAAGKEVQDCDCDGL
eukprot:352861-Chlamydomonas_euryale.AAC.6